MANQSMLDFLLRRRSAKPALLAEPGPDAEQVRTILTAAARVPDHKKLVPWRFIVLEGDARAKLGARAADVLRAEEAEAPSPVRLETERARLTRAPLVVVVVSSPRTDVPVPELEQVLSCGAACFNLCLAANALGFGTAWITEWLAFSPGIAQVLGLSSGERVAGFVYIGTETERQDDRDRPDLDAIVTRWQG